MEKLAIIGAGVSGLAAGIYGRLNGFDTEIYEMHTGPGGECTGWRRGEYYFDGCIHWLMGSKPGEPLNALWREVGALDDGVEILAPDVFYEVEAAGRTVKVYRSLDRLERSLLEAAPEDAGRIRELCADARALRKMEMPVEKPFDGMSAVDGLRLGAKMLPLMGKMKKYGSITVAQLADRFQSEAVRAALRCAMPVQYAATGLLLTLASLDRGDSGFPRGGSLPFAQRMERRYLELGGKVFYRSRVEEIAVEGGRATGIRLADGRQVPADWVISCADGYATLYRLLGGKYLTDEIRGLFSDGAAYPTYTTVLVSMGVDCDLGDQPAMLYTQAPSPVDAGGYRHETVALKNYCFDRTMVPPGKAVVTSALTADYDWWREKKADSEAYRREKERVAAEVISVLEHRYPQTRGRVEQVDVATPMTYERYCDAWRGAWMSFMTAPGQKTRFLTGFLPGLDRFCLSGQWVLPPGGLPGAVMTGRWTIQRLCARQKKKFVSSGK